MQVDEATSLATDDESVFGTFLESHCSDRWLHTSGLQLPVVD